MQPDPAIDPAEARKAARIADQMLIRRKDLYASMKRVYFLPKFTANAITIEALKNASNSNFFCPLAKEYLSKPRHQKCRNRTLRVSEVHAFVRFAVLKETGKELFFEEEADIDWYCRFTYIFHPGLHSKLFHDKEKAGDKLGPGNLDRAAYVRTTPRLLFFNTGFPSDDKNLFTRLQARRKGLSEAIVPSPNKSAAERKLNKLRKELMKCLRRFESYPGDEEAVRLFERQKEGIFSAWLDLLGRKNKTKLDTQNPVKSLEMTERSMKENYDHFFSEMKLERIDFERYFSPESQKRPNVDALIRRKTAIHSHADKISFVDDYLVLHKSFVWTFRCTTEFGRWLLRHPAFLTRGAPDDIRVFLFDVIGDAPFRNPREFLADNCVRQAATSAHLKGLFASMRHNKLGEANRDDDAIILASWVPTLLHLAFNFNVASFIESLFQKFDGRLSMDFARTVLFDLVQSAYPGLDPRFKPQLGGTFIGFLVCLVSGKGDLLAFIHRRMELAAKVMSTWTGQLSKFCGGGTLEALSDFCPDHRMVKKVTIQDAKEITDFLRKSVAMLCTPSNYFPLIFGLMQRLLTNVGQKDVKDFVAVADQYLTMIIGQTTSFETRRELMYKIVGYEPEKPIRDHAFGDLLYLMRNDAAFNDLYQEIGLPNLSDRTSEYSKVIGMLK